VQLIFHFTQAANLPGIVQHGLLPRQILQNAPYQVFASNTYRLDGNSAATSVSISRINADMFRRKQEASGHKDWVVLVLWPNILWEKDCRFCWANAATKEIRDCTWFRGGPFAFEKMFEGGADQRCELEPCVPTDPAAEVQVLSPIEPEFIRGAVVPRESLRKPVEAVLQLLPRPADPVEVHPF
jgi:hypothetical protein